MNRLLPWIVLVLGVGLLQAHAVRWWTELVTGGWPGWGWEILRSPWSGWGWAVALEAGALWCWPRRSTAWRAVALGCTVVLLAGVLWRVTDPAVRMLTAPAPLVQADEGARIWAARAEVAELAGQVETYAKDWTLRTKRTERLETLQDRLARARGTLAGLLAGREEALARARLDWRTGAGIAFQALAVIVLQVLVVLAVVTLFGWGKPHPPDPSPPAAVGEGEREREKRAGERIPEGTGRINWREVPGAELQETLAKAQRGQGAKESRNGRPAETTTGSELARLLKREIARRYGKPTLGEVHRSTGASKRDLAWLNDYDRHATDSTAGLEGALRRVRDALWAEGGKD